MSEAENQPELGVDPMVEDLQNEVQSLRTLVTVSLIVLVVFTVCINAFLATQISQVNKARDQAQMSAVTAKSQAAELWNKVYEFSKTHPDVAPILEKYRGAFETNQPAAAPAAPAARTNAGAPKK